MTRVLGFDPSLRNWGFAACIWENSTGLVIQNTGTISVKSEETKPNKRDMHDAQMLFSNVHHLLKTFAPDVVVAEIPIGSQNANGMKGYAICITILAIIKQMGIPIIEISPYDLKRVVGSTTASKKDVVNWVNKQHPNLLPTHRGQLNISQSEHIADAIVAIYAHLTTKGAYHANPTDHHS